MVVDVISAEQYGVGHCDYAAKVAYRLAQIVLHG